MKNIGYRAIEAIIVFKNSDFVKSFEMCILKNDQPLTLFFFPLHVKNMSLKSLKMFH